MQDPSESSASQDDALRELIKATTKIMQILNTKIDNITIPQTLQKIQEFLNSDKQHHISTINAEYILEAQKDKEFQEVINSSSLSVADGIGPIWAAKFLSLPTFRNKILRYPQIVLQYMYTGASLIFWPYYCKSVIKERVSGIELCEKILNSLSTRHPEAPLAPKDPFFQWQSFNITFPPLNNRILRHFASQDDAIKIFLLGGLNSTGKKIQEKHPDAIVGAYEGTPNPQSDEETRKIINDAKPNILFVAYGNPASKQEKWISRNLKYLPSVKVAMGVGGSFDFLSGQVKRAPCFMRNLGLEWMWRLIRQPRRIGRIWNAVIVFSIKVLIYKLTLLSTSSFSTRHPEAP